MQNCQGAKRGIATNLCPSLVSWTGRVRLSAFARVPTRKVVLPVHPARLSPKPAVLDHGEGVSDWNKVFMRCLSVPVIASASQLIFAGASTGNTRVELMQN